MSRTEIRPRLQAVVLAWWFLASAGSSVHSPVTTVGPYRDQAQCERYRQEWQGRGWSSSCWWDGMTPRG